MPADPDPDGHTAPGTARGPEATTAPEPGPPPGTDTRPEADHLPGPGTLPAAGPARGAVDRPGGDAGSGTGAGSGAGGRGGAGPVAMAAIAGPEHGAVPRPGQDPAGAASWRRGRAAAAGAFAVAAAVTAVMLTAGGDGAGAGDGKGPAAAGLPRTAVDAAPGTCGQGWSRGAAGTQVFELRNSGAATTDVDLVDPGSGKVYGEVEGLAPGTTRAMTVELGGGRYAFRCLQEDADAMTGPAVVVPGHLPRGPGALPVTQHDLIPPTLAYQRWIGGRMTVLAAGTAVLTADIDRGDLRAARRDWLSAHLVYERMGAAYGTFGDADGRINGTAARTAGGVRDTGFTGFHRVEYGLWHGEPATSLRAPAAALDKDVRALRASWSRARMDPADLGLRAHEIMENTEQFELTGRTDYGSGTNLATARANLDGTREVLARLHPLLAARDSALPRLEAALTRTARDLDAARRGGAWTPLDRLTGAERQRINADLGDLLEQLAPVAAIFDVRRTA